MAHALILVPATEMLVTAFFKAVKCPSVGLFHVNRFIAIIQTGSTVMFPVRVITPRGRIIAIGISVVLCDDPGIDTVVPLDPKYLIATPAFRVVKIVPVVHKPCAGSGTFTVLCTAFTGPMHVKFARTWNCGSSLIVVICGDPRIDTVLPLNPRYPIATQTVRVVKIVPALRKPCTGRGAFAVLCTAFTGPIYVKFASTWSCCDSIATGSYTYCCGEPRIFSRATIFC